MEVINNVKMSLGFNLRAPKKIDTQRIVYCVIKLDDKQIKLPIDCKVYSYQWDKKKQICKVNNTMMSEDRENNIKVNKKIFDIKCEYMEFINYLCAADNLSKEQIENNLRENINNIVMANKNSNLRDSVVRTKKATTILEKALKIYCEQREVKESSKEVYEGDINTFKKYCAEVGKDKESMLTQSGINDYQNYLIEKGNSNTNVNKKVKIICMLVNNVISVHNDFKKEQKTIKAVKQIRLKEVKATQIEDKKRRPLSDEEIRKLINCKLDDELSEYRDLFILQCYCGYRVSDTAKIWNKENYEYQKIGNNEYILITPKKEERKGVQAIIWLNDDVKCILKRYENGFKYADYNNRKFENTYNDNIKKISKIAELNTLENWINAKGEKESDYLYNIIASHFARYTFVSKCFDMGMSAEQIIMFSGHKDKTMINEVYGLRSKEQKFVIANDIIKSITKSQSNDAESITENELIAEQAKENFKLKKEKEEKENKLLEIELIEQKEMIAKWILEEYEEMKNESLEEDEILKEMGEDRYFAAQVIEPSILRYESIYGDYPNVEEYKELKKKYKNLINAWYGEEMEKARKEQKEKCEAVFKHSKRI